MAQGFAAIRFPPAIFANRYVGQGYEKVTPSLITVRKGVVEDAQSLCRRRRPFGGERAFGQSDGLTQFIQSDVEEGVGTHEIINRELN